MITINSVVKQFSNLPTKVILFIALITLLLFVALFRVKQTPTYSQIISPLPTANEKTKSQIPPASTYIYLSQQFLNKAQGLSKKDNQTPQDKKEILENVKRSVDTITEAISYYPNDASLFAHRAQIYLAVHSFVENATDAALKDFTKAQRLQPENPIFALKLGKLLADIGRWNDSVYYYYLAGELDPNNTQLLWDLAQAQSRAGQIRGAYLTLTKLLTFIPLDDPSKKQIENEKASLQKILDLAKKNQAGDQLQIIGEPLLPKDIDSKPAGIEIFPEEQAYSFKNLIIAESDEITNNSDKINSNALSETSILKANESNIKVYNQNINNNSFIYLSLEDQNETNVLSVINKKSGEYFTVGIDKPVNHDIKFKWWIVN